jgi:hypothetical protein
MWLVIPERAELVRRLNREGIPVIASLTMPPEQGFYFNAENALLDSEWMSATRNSPLTLGACHFVVHEKRGRQLRPCRHRTFRKRDLH